MNINRHNYESFFLLYADAELSGSDREMVDLFVLENADLKAEFEAFQETVLPGAFEKMELTGLFRSAQLEGNVLDSMLLHMDGELSQKEQEVLNEFLENEPVAQQEWTALQKTRLDADDIMECPDKAVLYKKEPARIVMVNYFRWAMAIAAILVLGFFVSFLFFNENDQVNPTPIASIENKTGNNDTVFDIANNNTALSPEKINDIAAQEEMVDKNPDQMAGEHVAQNAEKRSEKSPTDQKSQIAVNDKMQPQQAFANKVERVVMRDLKVKTPVLQNTNVTRIIPGEIALSEIPEKVKIAKQIRDIDLSVVDRTYAVSALQQESDHGEDKIFFIPVDDVERSKAGIFLKKLKRIVERKANISPGSSIRVANFEIALN